MRSSFAAIVCAAALLSGGAGLPGAAAAELVHGAGGAVVAPAPSVVPMGGADAPLDTMKPNRAFVLFGFWG